MSLLEKVVPYEILYYFVSTWLTIPQIHSMKQLNKYFRDLIKDVLVMKKYNKHFLKSQLQLLNPELTSTNTKISTLDNEILKIQNQKEELENSLIKLNETKLMLFEHQEQLHEYVSMFKERSFGKPNIWMITKPGFRKLRGLERPLNFILTYSATDNSDCKYYNISYVLESCKSKTWFWISRTKNTTHQLSYIDNFLTNLGWIKFFPFKKEKDTAFVYCHPDEPFLDQILRKKFNVCWCGSKIHSLYNCTKYRPQPKQNKTKKHEVYGTKTILKKTNII